MSHTSMSSAASIFKHISTPACFTGLNFHNTICQMESFHMMMMVLVDGGDDVEVKGMLHCASRARQGQGLTALTDHKCIQRQQCFLLQKNDTQLSSLIIKLLESPIPTAAPPSQKAHCDNISGTKRGTIDPLVSKRPEKDSK